MQPNKKYVASDGYEYFMCPMTTFKITQTENVGTHRGTKAVDFASETPGKRAAYYAPATVKCISTYPASGQGIWQTTNKVHCPNGYFGYVTFCTVHDDSFNAYVGMVVPQGIQLGNMGIKGYATGVHLHIEFIQSIYPGWIKNSYGIWTFKGNESYVDDTFYVDDTNILTPMAGNWRKTGASPQPTPTGSLIEEAGRATFRNDIPINVHQDSPNGTIVGKKNKGDIQDYRWKYVGNGHRYIVWESNGHKLYCAVSSTEQRPAEGSDGQWATFGPISEAKPESKPGDSEIKNQLISEKGTAYFRNTTPIIIHKDSPTGPKVGQFVKGEKQDYTEKYIGNGHRYISWLEPVVGNARCYAAVSATEARPVDGSDEQWATFEAISEPKPESKPEQKPEPKPEFPASVKYKGVDWSEHNTTFDLNGVDFVILRSNWWTTKDKKFDELSKMLEEKGIPYGVYCYDYCGDEETALEQAKFTHELIKDRKISCGVWMDMEDADGWKKKNNYLNKEHCEMVCKVFCDYFKEQGYYTGVYSTKHWFETLCPTEYPKWVANWGTNDGTCQSDFSGYAVMHQYTSTPLDKNVMYIDMKDMASNPKKEEEIPLTPLEPSQPVEKPTERPEEKPEEKPAEKPLVEEEQIKGSLVNKLLSLLINFFEKIMSLFK